jgi:hypothetical protein
MLFIDDLLLLPFTGFKAIMNTLAKVALEQYTDDAPIKQRLLDLQVQLDNGDITEDEYVEHEAAILRELREIQQRKMELAGVSPDEMQSGGFAGAPKETDLGEASFEVSTFLDEKKER